MKRVNQTSFYSELLNVYAYLRTQAGNVADQLEKTGDEIISTSRTVAANRKELDQMMCQAHKLSELTGIPFEPSVVKRKSLPKDTLRMPVPGEQDFEAEFEHLKCKAHEAGFVNVKVQNLLTEKEIRDAESVANAINTAFEGNTGLNSQDWQVLVLGVAMHMLRIFVIQKALSHQSGQEVGKSQLAEQPLSSLSPDMNMPGESLVDHKLVTSDSQLWDKSLGLIQNAMRYAAVNGPVRIKSSEEIYQDQPLFLLDVFERQYDLPLGTRKIIGWLPGIMNIMTDTVTCSSGRTYILEERYEPIGIRQCPRKIGLIDYLAPLFAVPLSHRKDEIVAAVIREACILLPKEKNDFTNVRDVLEKNRSGKQFLQRINQLLGNSLKMLSDAGLAQMINMIIIVIHGLYQKNGESASDYMLRTMKVVSLSNAIASSSVTIGALLEECPNEADWGGMINAIINVVQTAKYWIDVKAEYLVQYHRGKLEEMMQQLQEYMC